MNLPSLALLLTGFGLAAPLLPATPPPAPASPTARVGVYDSRLVAFAHFWSEPYQQAFKERMAEARRAKASNDTARAKQLTDAMKAEQSRLHLQVFSTAPIPEALSALQARLPALQQEAGVDRLVSRWDTAALRDIPAGERVDVTDLLVREFHLPEPRRATLEQMRTAAPLPLWKARTLEFFGGL